MLLSFEEKLKLGVLQIVFVYAGFSALWIYCSDSVMTMITQDPFMLKRLSIIKGMLFILVTAIFLYALLLRYVNELLKSYDELRKGTIRLERALTVANQGFYELDIKSGVATVSNCYWSMLGYTGAKPVADIDWWQNSLHPDDRDNAVSVLQECISGKRSEYKMCYRLKTKSGEWKWIESAGQVVQYGDDQKPLIMIGMHTDLDDRKKTLENV